MVNDIKIVPKTKSLGLHVDKTAGYRILASRVRHCSVGRIHRCHPRVTGRVHPGIHHRGAWGYRERRSGRHFLQNSLTKIKKFSKY